MPNFSCIIGNALFILLRLLVKVLILLSPALDLSVLLISRPTKLLGKLSG